jgi:hypothetical protein
MSDQTSSSSEKTLEELEAEARAVCEAVVREIQKMIDEQNTNYQSVSG